MWLEKGNSTYPEKKTSIFDSMTYNKGRMCMTSCDLKSCYNRIVHSMIIITACNFFGVPKISLISFFHTTTSEVHLHSIWHFNGNLWRNARWLYSKPHREGQGNSAAPKVWENVSSKMFKMLHELGLAFRVKEQIKIEKCS